MQVVAKNTKGIGTWLEKVTGTPSTEKKFRAGPIGVGRFSIHFINHTGSWPFKMTCHNVDLNCDSRNILKSVFTGSRSLSATYTFKEFSKRYCSYSDRYGSAVSVTSTSLTASNIVTTMVLGTTCTHCRAEADLAPQP